MARKTRKGFFLKIFFIFFIPFAFLIVGTAILKDYGMNWDEPYHFMRGQAYLHFFLTGEKDYSSLDDYPRLSSDCPSWATGFCNISPGGATDVVHSQNKGIVYEDAINLFYKQKGPSVWRSFFQHDSYDFKSFVTSENGHPPINDILSAFSNYIFYQKLHWLGDIESHHFFEVFSSFLIILGVAVLVYYHFGIFSSMVASFSLAFYPLFFSESHFNIKDPPEAAFFGLTIIFFYFGIIKNNWKFILISAVFSGIALGTKFNAVFIAPVLAIWLIYYLFSTFLLKRTKKIFSLENFRKIIPLLISLVLYPAITLCVFYIFWPYLWSDPINNLSTIIGFYKQIGLGVPAELSKFLIHGWNTYPIIWIIYTTPLPILFLTAIGIAVSVFLSVFRRKHLMLLALLWFLVPILRASLPNASIYGGVRQIMEFVPGMAVLAGIGAWSMIKRIKKKNSGLEFMLKSIIIFSLFFTVIEMVKIHPNENVYFNQIIGGLSGARSRKIPYWGNTYGNVYQQGVNWLNENLEPNAKLGLPISTMGNISRLKLRTDIDFQNAHWSGTGRKGEYEIELDFDWPPKSWYSYAYYDVFLEPVYKVEVDGVPILKIWKNDLAYTRSGFSKEKEYKPLSLLVNDGVMKIDLGKEIYLTEIKIKHSVGNCETQKGGYIAISKNKSDWERETEPIDYPQVPPSAVGITDNNFVYLFAAKKARYLLLDTLMKNSCLLKNYKVQINGLEKSVEN